MPAPSLPPPAHSLSLLAPLPPCLQPAGPPAPALPFLRTPFPELIAQATGTFQWGDKSPRTPLAPELLQQGAPLPWEMRAGGGRASL